MGQQIIVYFHAISSISCHLQPTFATAPPSSPIFVATRVRSGLRSILVGISGDVQSPGRSGWRDSMKSHQCAVAWGGSTAKARLNALYRWLIRVL